MFLEAPERIKPSGQSCETSALLSYTKSLSLSLSLSLPPSPPSLSLSLSLSLPACPTPPFPVGPFLFERAKPRNGTPPAHAAAWGSPLFGPQLRRPESANHVITVTTVTTVTSTAMSWGCPGLTGNCQNRPGKLGGCWTGNANDIAVWALASTDSRRASINKVDCRGFRRVKLLCRSTLWFHCSPSMSRPWGPELMLTDRPLQLRCRPCPCCPCCPRCPCWPCCSHCPSRPCFPLHPCRPCSTCHRCLCCPCSPCSCHPSHTCCPCHPCSSCRLQQVHWNLALVHCTSRDPKVPGLNQSPTNHRTIAEVTHAETQQKKERLEK